MARAKNKEELISFSNANFETLLNLISGMTEKQMTAPFDFSGDKSKTEAHWARDKNVRDVIVHLYEWHQLLLAYVKINLDKEHKSTGKKTAFLPAEYSWKTYGKMNVVFWQKHQETPLQTALEMLKKSHARVMALAESFTDEELFTKKYYDFTGTSSLGSYFVSNCSSHYDWAIRKIKCHCKKVGK
ncbi:MAG: ClbS/DfsB family four-helix bundle protein [Treponema sp.]|nr:ClbS/DfsB family four-helix bundle protein [Spirochaetia bacterium]MDD7459517.1 ClbS/DfsB family four-helix bundle protein [Spirochaetales bacterium]MDY5810823.1 ClbS/DfsB family four-helix bundle protein [Treponema sp.]MEE1181452.1 ClbS/DfsB family four-helix bundle protein [Treponema sp.]